jgi:hypothetical protein
MGCWRRVVHDAAAEQFGCASARRILAEALGLLQSDYCADTQLASLEIDSLIVETIALHAEELTGREYDRADICALATVRGLALLLSGSNSVTVHLIAFSTEPEFRHTVDQAFKCAVTEITEIPGLSARTKCLCSHA